MVSAPQGRVTLITAQLQRALQPDDTIVTLQPGVTQPGAGGGRGTALMADVTVHANCDSYTLIETESRVIGEAA